MGPLLGWRAWYADGQIYANEAWQAFRFMPPTGVVVVVCYRNTGKTIYSGGDWYWFEQGGEFKYIPSQGWDGWEELPAGICMSCTKRGDAVPDDVFAKMCDQAKASEWLL